MSRRPTDEELKLWRQVATTATPLDRQGRYSLDDSAPNRKQPGQNTVGPGAPRSQVDAGALKIGSRAPARATQHDLAQSQREWMARAPLHMDKKTHAKMKRGTLKPEARIDLHGMTLAEAHPRLIAFVRDQHARGRRLVLIITGKGKSTEDTGPIPQRPGLLRRAVPTWLQHPAISGAVLQIAEAHQRHGGGGAYYVYLRRSR